MLRVVVLTLVLAGGGCYRTAHDDGAAKRIATLEQRVAEQDQAIAEARASGGSVELTAIATQVTELVAKVAELQAELARRPASPSMPAKRREPDPSSVYAFPLGTSPQLGSPKAKVTMVMIYEFACLYCHKAWATVDELRKKYGKDLRVVYKQYVVHPKIATAAAHASCAAALQGKWRLTADLLWSKAFEPRRFDQATIDAIALEAGLDIARYQSDSASTCPTEIASDLAVIKKFAVSATPTFFINGRFIAGAKPLAAFTELIDEEMKKANAAIKAGVKPDKLYEVEVLGKGLTDVPVP